MLRAKIILSLCAIILGFCMGVTFYLNNQLKRQKQNNAQMNQKIQFIYKIWQQNKRRTQFYIQHRSVFNCFVKPHSSWQIKQTILSNAQTFNLNITSLSANKFLSMTIQNNLSAVIGWLSSKAFALTCLVPITIKIKQNNSNLIEMSFMPWNQI